jgi:hypothetical protein
MKLLSLFIAILLLENRVVLSQYSLTCKNIVDSCYNLNGYLAPCNFKINFNAPIFLYGSFGFGKYFTKEKRKKIGTITR